MSAAMCWIGSFFMIAAVMLSLDAVDLNLDLDNKQTITQWLRLHPAWFFWPALISTGFWILLGLHLFWGSRNAL